MSLYSHDLLLILTSGGGWTKLWRVAAVRKLRPYAAYRLSPGVNHLNYISLHVRM
jgi:hypothetical protein